MKIIKNKTNIDFVGKGKVAFFISMLLNIAIVVGLAIFGFNFGVDFAGGTLVEINFEENLSAEEVRQRAEAGGLQGVSVQRIGPEEDHEFILRMGGTTQLTEETGAQIETAIGEVTEVERFDVDSENGLIKLRSASALQPERLREVVESTGMGVSDVRSLGSVQGGGFEYQIVASGMAQRIQRALLPPGGEADFQTRRVDYVGPQVGKQLRNKGIKALVYAALAIMAYVALRFDFKFGPGALVAMVHDVIMVCGFYLVTRIEFNLTSVAAILTIIGYSVNDTIVIFDRIREDLVQYKGKPLREVINLAINNVLSRTIVTTLTTALSLIGLLVFTTGDIRDFAAAMLVGMLVGVYSTIYVMSPVTLWLEERFGDGTGTSTPQVEGVRVGA